MMLTIVTQWNLEPEKKAKKANYITDSIPIYNFLQK